MLVRHRRPPLLLPPSVGYAEDIAKGAAGGLGRGVAGLVGLPGDIAEYGARGIDWATRKVGGAIRMMRSAGGSRADLWFGRRHKGDRGRHRGILQAADHPRPIYVDHF